MSNSKIKYDFVKNKTCPYCQSKIKQGADFIICTNCGTPHHKECWEENKGCTTYGCENNPNSEKKLEMNSQDVSNETIDSIRESLRENLTANITACPNCRNNIDDSSKFCKYCGYNIADKGGLSGDEAKQKFEKEYKKRYKDKISFSRRRFFLTAGSFLILVLAFSSLLYFTITKLNSYFSSDEYKIQTTVYGWKDSWESENLEKYKSYLTEDYEYFGKDGKKINLKEKLKRIEFTFKNYKDIKISIADFKIITDSSTTAVDKKVQFLENYESDKFRESGLKTLRLFNGAETNGEWKIYREIFEDPVK